MKVRETCEIKLDRPLDECDFIIFCKSRQSRASEAEKTNFSKSESGKLWKQFLNFALQTKSKDDIERSKLLVLNS